MSPGGIDAVVVRRHLLALDAALAILGKSRGLTAAELAADRERLWIVERGLQLCAQNALDVATHLASTASATSRSGSMPTSLSSERRSARRTLVLGSVTPTRLGSGRG